MIQYDKHPEQSDFANLTNYSQMTRHTYRQLQLRESFFYFFLHVFFLFHCRHKFLDIIDILH